MTDIDKADINWSKTKAWGWGGYYARIFFNVKGREPEGIVDKKDLEREKAELTRRIMGITDDKGNKLQNQVLVPDELYGTAIGDKPDLMVYFGDLFWRSAGTIGHPSNYLFENDTGPDDSVHSMNGIFMMYDPRRNYSSEEIKGAHIEDIAPTLLNMYGYDSDASGMDGRKLNEVLSD
jgi:predicted AlkP superfamily phosphohydrolase/phosphomutase